MNEEIIEMFASGLVVSVPEDENDNRTFLSCQDCKETFLLFDPATMSDPIRSTMESLAILPRLIEALHHITICPAEPEKEASDDGSTSGR